MNYYFVRTSEDGLGGDELFPADKNLYRHAKPKDWLAANQDAAVTNLNETPEIENLLAWVNHWNSQLRSYTYALEDENGICVSREAAYTPSLFE